MLKLRIKIKKWNFQLNLKKFNPKIIDKTSIIIRKNINRQNKELITRLKYIYKDIHNLLQSKKLYINVNLG